MMFEGPTEEDVESSFALARELFFWFEKRNVSTETMGVVMALLLADDLAHVCKASEDQERLITEFSKMLTKFANIVRSSSRMVTYQ